jgi:hypothetical protein
VFSRPTSLRIWRIASRNGSDSMSPTGAADLDDQHVDALGRGWIAALISSVTCGITWTVPPR